MNDWEVNRLKTILAKPAAQVTAAEVIFLAIMVDKIADASPEQAQAIADLIGVTVDELTDL